MLAKEEDDKRSLEMKAYDKKLSPEIRSSVYMMAAAVRQGTKGECQAAANNTFI